MRRFVSVLVLVIGILSLSNQLFVSLGNDSSEDQSIWI